MGTLRNIDYSLDDVSADLERIADSLERMVAIFERAEDSIRYVLSPLKRFLP